MCVVINASRMAVRMLLSAGLLMFADLTSVHAASQATTFKSPRISCSSMVSHQIDAKRIALPTRGATIISAELNAASDGDDHPADALPQYCAIMGEIHPVDPKAPPIRFGMAIPTRWAQKTLQVGGGGVDGYIPLLAKLNRRAGSPTASLMPADAPFPVAQGFATYGGDSGHGGATAPGEGPPPAAVNNDWLMNDESYLNFGHAQIKKTHDVAMAILSDMYGAKPRYNYFAGISSGGRAALNAAARYGNDYDGVFAGVPLSYFTSLQLRNLQRIRAQLAPGAWLPPAKAAAVHKETLRQCDSLDGLKDGVISNYYQCYRLFDPTITAHPLAAIRCAGGADTGNECLSDAQITMIDAYHATGDLGFTLANGKSLMPGQPAGAENNGWLMLIQKQPKADDLSSIPAPHSHLTIRVASTEQLFTKDLRDFQQPIQKLSEQLDTPPDWSKLFAHHGKLIIYSTGSDYLANPRNTMQLYEDATAKHGEAVIKANVRYYVMPFATHDNVGKDAQGNALPMRVDMLSALTQWVERGITPPEVLVQKITNETPPYAVIRSRPLCQYPAYPAYVSGDANQASAFQCTQPSVASVAKQSLK